MEISLIRGQISMIAMVLCHQLLHYLDHSNWLFKKNRWQIRGGLQFSDAKDPSTYSFGGEDGLEETPLINPNAVALIDQFAGSPAWNDFSVLANYGWSEQVRLKLGVENIFDIHYRTFASGISAPGRSFRFGIQVDL